MRDREDISLLAAHVAYQHHERQDGLGFPRQLKGANRIVTRSEALHEGSGLIHRYANIVAVPNYYDSLISNLSYKKAIGPDEAVSLLRKSAGTMLNREVVEVFLAYLPVFPVSTPVVVTGGKLLGYRGVVLRVTPDSLDRPVIRLLYDRKKKLKTPIEIDLKDESFPIKPVWR